MASSGAASDEDLILIFSGRRRRGPSKGPSPPHPLPFTLRDQNLPNEQDIHIGEMNDDNVKNNTNQRQVLKTIAHWCGLRNLSLYNLRLSSSLEAKFETHL